MSVYDPYDQTQGDVIGDDEIMADLRRVIPGRAMVRQGAPQQAARPVLRAQQPSAVSLQVPAGLGSFSFDDSATDLTFTVEVEPQIPFIVERLIADLVTDDDAVTALIDDISVAGQPMTPVTGEPMSWKTFAHDATAAHAAFTPASGSRKLLIRGHLNQAPDTMKTATITFSAYGRMLQGSV